MISIKTYFLLEELQKRERDGREKGRESGRRGEGERKKREKI